MRTLFLIRAASTARTRPKIIAGLAVTLLLGVTAAGQPSRGLQVQPAPASRGLQLQPAPAVSIQLQNGAFKVAGWKAPASVPAGGWASLFNVYARQRRCVYDG